MKSWLNSAKWAIHGLIFFFRTERNARIEGVMAIIALMMGFYLNISRTEFALIGICIGLVLSAEIFNTALEHMANRITKDLDDRIRVIKDLSAGAVMLLACTSAAIGILIFAPKLLALIHL